MADSPVVAFARWTGFEDGCLVWDETKISGLSSKGELKKRRKGRWGEEEEEEEEEEGGRDWEPNSLKRVFEGIEVSGKIYPLLIEKSNDQRVKYRSLDFLSHLCETPSLFEDLKEDERLFVGLGIRDLFLACNLGVASPSDRSLFDRVTTTIDHFTIARDGGIGISFFPTHSQKLHRYLQDLPSSLDENSKIYFAQTKLKGTFVVFVDPEELSYHNFENILPIDCVFERNQKKSEDGNSSQLVFSLSGKKTFEKKDGVVSFTLSGSTDSLLGLDELNLYNPVLNEQSRGGKRFIFQSSLLSKALSKAVRETGHFAQNFRFVNYVFRLNKFEPSDRKFESHFDTPYYNRSCRHISRYTILIYLNGGKGKPVLRIEDLFFNQIEPMTCLIFPQSLEHEGRPFDEGTKMFIRSELIFEEPALKHDPKVGSIFSKAVYLTGESLFKKELSPYAQLCYDRAARLHWNLQTPQVLSSEDETVSNEKDEKKSSGQEDVILHKEFSGIHFLTNGYDYWFSNQVDLKRACVVTLLDYFNCLVDGVSFRKLSYVEVLERKSNGEEEEEENWRKVLQRLSTWKQVSKGHPSFMSSTELFPALSERDFDDCCPRHSGAFCPSESDRVRDFYQSDCVCYSKKKLDSVVFSFFGNSVYIHEDQITLIGDKVFVDFKKGEKIPPVNFAACQWSDCDGNPSEYVDTAGHAEGHIFSVPPILVSKSDQLGYHLMFDLFRNDWMVKHGSVDVPIPRITEGPSLAKEPFAETINPDYDYWGDNEILDPVPEEEEVLNIKPARAEG